MWHLVLISHLSKRLLVVQSLPALSHVLNYIHLACLEPMHIVPLNSQGRLSEIIFAEPDIMCMLLQRLIDIRRRLRVVQGFLLLVPSCPGTSPSFRSAADGKYSAEEHPPLIMRLQTAYSHFSEVEIYTKEGGSSLLNALCNWW